MFSFHWEPSAEKDASLWPAHVIRMIEMLTEVELALTDTLIYHPGSMVKITLLKSS